MNVRKYILAPVINATRLHRYFNYQHIGKYEPDDIFLVGFPKSGNSWLQHLMTGIVYEATMSSISNRLARELTPDVHLSQFYKRYADRVCFKSHHLPVKAYRNVIYIVRDGRDAVNSYYHMLTGLGTKTNMRQLIIEGKHLFPSKWHEHVRQWLNNPYNARMHFVRYEDLQSDPLAEMQKICQFIGMERSDAFLAQVIEHCSFASMRAKETSKLWDKNQKWQKDKFFVRKGVVGDFRNHMEEDLIRLFEKESERELKHFGYLD